MDGCGDKNCPYLDCEECNESWRCNDVIGGKCPCDECSNNPNLLSPNVNSQALANLK